ncbi:hypothetical protein K2173_017057 [Erythroxylum novogranatense]|uniref:Piriformospora indica-insensitive protein 2 n=1 Tax=Erythroxylum novogranatense TaxID=1862640 RepID=A0AAV8U5L0_9ROSI|nr:hypothetical protein K2173_017057 [Erythroxylum novogranatense]
MAMKGFVSISRVVLVLCLLWLNAWCLDEADNDVAPMEKAEQQALYSAIQGFVGNWWNGSELYPDPCGWTPIQGVSCDLFDGLWYVTALSIGPIHDNSLGCAQNVKFSPQLFQLKHLKSLSFFSCFMSPKKHLMTIPNTSWANLAENLETLEFRANTGLVGELPSILGSLIKLQSLVILENGLTGELPRSFGNLVHLKRLVLAGNLFGGSIPDTYGGLTELLILDLSRNSLSGSFPLTFGGLTSLLKLDLSNNQLEGNLPMVIGYLRNLTLLDLRNNKFSGGLTESLQDLHSLEEMALSKNPIGGSIMSIKWQNLQNLVILDLSNIGLVGEIPESIAELNNLRFLGLSDNYLSGNLPTKLANLPSLNALYLSGNNLTGELKFSELFYGKLGRRFEAWNNPNLCYPLDIMSANHAPSGVKPCQKQEVTLLELNSKSKLVGASSNLNSEFAGSFGFSTHGIKTLPLVFLQQILTMVLLLN